MAEARPERGGLFCYKDKPLKDEIISTGNLFFSQR